MSLYEISSPDIARSLSSSFLIGSRAEEDLSLFFSDLSLFLSDFAEDLEDTERGLPLFGAASLAGFGSLLGELFTSELFGSVSDFLGDGEGDGEDLGDSLFWEALLCEPEREREPER